MKKIIALAVLLAFAVPAFPVFAEETTQSGTTDAGNKLCPVSGDPVSGQDFVEYQGKRYGLCCPMCKAPFLSDPKKYIAQMEAKEKASDSTAVVTPDASKSKEMEKDMEQGSL